MSGGNNSYLIIGKETVWGEPCLSGDMKQMIYQFLSSNIKSTSSHIIPTRFKGNASPSEPIQNFVEAGGDLNMHLHVDSMLLWWKYLLMTDLIVSTPSDSKTVRTDGVFASPISLTTQPSATVPSSAPGRLTMTFAAAQTGVATIAGTDQNDVAFSETLTFAAETVKTTTKYFKTVNAGGITLGAGFAGGGNLLITCNKGVYSHVLTIDEDLLVGLTAEVVKGSLPYTYTGLLCNTGRITVADVITLALTTMGKYGEGSHIPPVAGAVLTASETPVDVSAYDTLTGETFPAWGIEVDIDGTLYCVKDVSLEIGNNLAYPDRWCGTRYRQKPRRSGERNIRFIAGVELTDTTNIFDDKFMNLDDVVVQFKCYRKPSYGAEYMIQIDLPRCKIIAHPDPDVTDYVEVMQTLEFYPIRTVGATDSDEASVTLQCTETGAYEETGTLKSGSVTGIVAAEKKTLNLTGLPSDSMTVKKIRAWISNDPTGDVNVDAILRFYGKDTFIIGDLIYETVLNLTYTETNGIAVGEITDIVDSIGGLAKGDLVRFLDPAAVNTPEYARLTEQPNGTTINFNPALYAHTNNTSVVKVYEFDGDIALVDADASLEIHLEIETVGAPIGATSVYFEVVSVTT
jgi:hypothetical protein